MAYVVRKTKGSWKVQLETYPDGKRTARSVKGKELRDLGVLPEMPFEHVKLVLKDINKRVNLVAIDIKRSKISARLESEAAAQVRYLPEHLVKEFEAELNALPDPKNVASYWRATKRLICTTKIPPNDWRRQKQALYNYFEQQCFSDAYAKKIFRMLNMWGEFWALRTGSQYTITPPPKGHARARIRKTYEASRRQNKASSGLTVEILATLKELPREQQNWLHVSLWFGLRPGEMRNLARPELTYFSKEGEQEALNVKQTKLSNLPDDDQWKIIPVLYPEQRVACDMVRKHALATPLPKTLQRHTKGNYKLYAGRKGFGPLMWERGHDIVEVSSWLGHKSIDRTYKDYMKWQKLKLRKVS